VDVDTVLLSGDAVVFVFAAATVLIDNVVDVHSPG